MTDPLPPASDPFSGLDPEVLAILAARSAGEPTGEPAAGGPAAGGPEEPHGAGDAGLGRARAVGSEPGNHHRAASRAAAVAMGLLVVAGAAADPSGLAAPVAWSRASLAVEPWTWLQYVLLAPLLVVLVWAGSSRLLRPALPAAPRRWVLVRIWLLVALVMMAAKLVYSAVLMAPALLGGAHEGMPWATSLPYLVWATGFTGIKGLLLGWVPAGAAALAWRPGAARRSGQPSTTREPTLALLPAALVTLGLAALGGWTAQHWWLGSPMGYAHTTDWRLLAPVAAGGRTGWIPALLVVWLLMAWSISATLRRVGTPREGAARALAGALGAVAALLGLAVVQSFVALLLGTDVAGSDDLWILPSTYVRLAEALSFGLLLAPAAAIATFVVPALPRPQWGWVAAVTAGAVTAGAVVLVLRTDRADAPITPLAGTAPAPVALPAQPVLPQGEPAPPGRITVRRDADGSAVLADQTGAQVVLRGVNVNQLGEYYAADPALPTVEPLTEQDFADIASLGFDAVRLTMSWSLLEPESGRIDDAYLDRVKQAVAWARQQGIHVVLDMHQDAWGTSVVAPPGTRCRAGTQPMTGWDGAPEWATLGDGAPPCQFTGRDLAPNVLRAFTSLYTDRDGIETHLVEAWGRLAREFGGDPTVAGYDLLNEPSFAEQAPLTSGMLLGRYAARAIAAIRAGEAAAPDGYAHPVFLEPSIWWSGFGMDPLPPRGFVTDPQVVFSPHLYNESITMDQSVGLTTVGIERGYALAQRAAAAWGVPLWSGEWGSFSDPATNRARYERFTAVEDQLRVGSAVWVWKQACGDPHVYPGPEAGNIRRVSCPDGASLPTRSEELAPLTRAYPRSAPGRIVALRTDGRRVQVDGDTTGAGDVDGTADPCRLDVWVPGAVEPTVVDSTNVRDLRAVSVPAGSAVQAPSGGWRVIGCAEGAYRLTLS
jgi:hypothetical protein